MVKYRTVLNFRGVDKRSAAQAGPLLTGSQPSAGKTVRRLLQMSRPISMKKNGIQSRNRKLSMKSKRRKRTSSADAAIGTCGSDVTYDRPCVGDAFNAAMTSCISGGTNLQSRLIPIVPTGNSNGRLIADEQSSYYGRYYSSGSDVSGCLRRSAEAVYGVEEKATSFHHRISSAWPLPPSRHHHQLNVEHHHHHHRYRPEIIQGVV